MYFVNIKDVLRFMWTSLWNTSSKVSKDEPKTLKRFIHCPFCGGTGYAEVVEKSLSAANTETGPYEH